MSNNPDSKALMLATRQQLEAQQVDFEAVLPAGVTFDKFRNVVLTALAMKPELLEADRRSLFLACRQAAVDGLLLDGREAALVEYRTRTKAGDWVRLVQYQPMVTGLRKLAINTGLVRSIYADVVRRGETFHHAVTMDGPEFRHEKPLEAEINETDDGILAAYVRAELDTGEVIVRVMRRADLLKRRDASRSKNRDGEVIGPWRDWFAEQCKKTVIKSVCTHDLPRSNENVQRLIAAAAREDEEISLPPGRPPRAAIERRTTAAIAAPVEDPAPPASVDPPRAPAPVEEPSSPAANLEGEGWEAERAKVAAIADADGFPPSHLPGDDDMPEMPDFLNRDFDRRMGDDRA